MVSSSGDPYVICSEEEFNLIALDHLDSSFILGQHLDFSETDITPVGSDSAPFTGTFNGNGFSIHSYSIDLAADEVGLFRSASTTSNIQNLFVANAEVSGQAKVGAVVGQSDGVVSNVVVVASTVTASGNNAGGIAGYIEGNATASIQQSWSAATVSGVNYVGGVVGHSEFGKLIQVASTATVTGSADGVGGIAGRVNDNSLSGDEFSDCYSAATVTGVNRVGGVVGTSATRGSWFLRIFNESTVSGSGERIGGFIGEDDNGIWQSVASRASVTATGNYRGSFGGYFDPSMSMGPKVVDETTSNMAFATGGATPSTGSDSGFVVVNTDGSAADYFQDETNSPLTAFDFTDEWIIETGSYPRLRWQWLLTNTAE